MHRLFRHAFVVILLLFVTVGHVRSDQSNVLKITSENWRETLEGQWIIKFYAPWCPACRSMEADYKILADWSDDLNMQVAEVDINKEAGLSGRFIVTALPSIYHAVDGEFRRYTGPRDTNSLHKFIEDEIWRGTEPISWYRHPDSIPMSLMSALFQTSVLMKNFHETLTETYGFSNTVSYIIFALVTIATGLILGLTMVFIIDCVSPPKPRGKPVPSMPASQAGAGDAGEESEEQDDEDDRESTGRESLSGSEKGEGDAETQRSKDDGSEVEEDGRESQASSKSSSQTSQEWEKVQGEEAEEAENAMSVEKEIIDEPQEVESEVRKRNTARAGEKEEA